MHKIRKSVHLICAGLLAIGILTWQAPVAEAAVFMKYDGVDGEAADANHDKWIDVLSVDWGSAKPSRSAPGERLMQPKMGAGTVTLARRIDKASPALMRRKKNKRRANKIILDVENPRGGYMKYELKNVMITSYTTSGSGAAMTETMTLNYQKIRLIPSRARLAPKRK